MASKVDFGLWYDFRNPEPWQIDFEQFYHERLDQIARAETMGFDSVWLTEHHFCDDGYTPSPLVIHAAIAARTERMRLGTNLMLLHCHLFQGGALISELASAIASLSSTSLDARFPIGLAWSKRGSKLFVAAGPVKRSILRGSDSRWVTSKLRPSQTAPRKFCWAAWRPLPLIAPHALPTGFCALGASAWIRTLSVSRLTAKRRSRAISFWGAGR